MPTPPLPIITPTSLTYRSTEGRLLPLSNLELDGNMAYLESIAEDKLPRSEFTANNIIDLVNDSNTASVNAGKLQGYSTSIESEPYTVPVRDANGYIYADAVTAANFYGKATAAAVADSAKKLKSAVEINGVSFDGSAAITVKDSTKLQLTGGTLTGKLITATSTATSAGFRIQPGAKPDSPVNGDIWVVGSEQYHRLGGITRTAAYTDSNITGTASNVTGIVAIANGGIGASNIIDARKNLGAAKSGVNNDILRLSALTTAITTSQGGTGLTSPGASGNVLTSDGTKWVSAPAGSSTPGSSTPGSSTSTAVSSVPVGSIVAFSGTKPPSGWLICDGRTVLRSKYPNLWNVIGVLYGRGDGSTTFGIPDLRGMFIRGLDRKLGIDKSTNRLLGSRQEDSVSLDYVRFDNVSSSIRTFDLSGHGVLPTIQLQTATEAQIAASETRPVNIALHYCIYAGGNVTEQSEEYFTLTPEFNTVNEGGSLLFNITGSNILSRASVYWECESIVGASDDFVTKSDTAQVTTNGSGSFTITVNYTIGSNHTFRVILYDNSLKSTKLAESSIVTIESFGKALWAWGSNEYGQLGAGDRTNRLSPVQVGALTNWRSVATGDLHTVAIKTDGTLWSWGWNNFGQLGTGNTIDRSSPVQVGALTNWKSVTAGSSNNVAIKTDGTLWAWGRNDSGQLGTGNTDDRSSPVQVGALTNWKSVSGGSNHTAAIKTDGTLWTWGYNGGWVGGTGAGQLGTGDTVSRSSPVQVGDLTNWKSVAAGYTHTTAIKTDGTLWTWGLNDKGQLGTGDRTNRSSPVQVGALTNWQSVAGGSHHTIAIKTDGTLWAWGFNIYGQLGTGDTVSRSSPVQVGALTNWGSIASGLGHTVAIKTDGTLWTWGWNEVDQLGTGDTAWRSSPVQVGSLTNWQTVNCSHIHTMALAFSDS